MKTQPVIDSIESHLKALFKDIAVELFPDDPDRYRLNHPHGAILIGYQSSDYQESEDVLMMNQPRFAMLHFTIMARSQWGDKGAIALLDRLREALAGFSPINCQKGQLMTERFVASESGIWMYLLAVRFKTRNIEHSDSGNSYSY